MRNLEYSTVRNQVFVKNLVSIGFDKGWILRQFIRVKRPGMTFW